MKRIGAFAGLILAFLVFTFPHRLVVNQLFGKRLARMGIYLQVADVHPAWPPGYALEDVRLATGPYGLAIENLELGVNPFSGTVYFDANACGGSLNGYVTNHGRDGGNLVMHFDSLDASTCATLDTLVLGGALGGQVQLKGLGKGTAKSVLGRAARTARIELEAPEGSISGHLPAPGKPRKGSAPTGVALGSWNFTDAHLMMHFEESGNAVIDEAEAEAEGVELNIAPARLSREKSGRISLTASMRARRRDDRTRSKAIIALLPRATENGDGWHRYKISGTLDAPSIIGLR